MPRARSKSTQTTQDFSHFLPEISDKIQGIADTYLESYNEHHAFVYLIAELYETTHEDKFVFSDGPGDGGIDFYVKDAPSYTICQCKCPQLDIITDVTRPPKFDQSALEELQHGLKILRDRTGKYDIKNEIKRLRGDYQRDLNADPESIHLTAILAVLGELTGPAHTTFKSYKSSLASEGIHLKLIQWKDIYHSLHVLESPSSINFNVTIHFVSTEDILPHTSYCYVLAHAFDFYQAFRDHEWNLFEWNVRYQIPNSSINKRIVTALSRAKSRKWFHHYNNGLLITCKNYRIDNRRKKITLIGPQVINGCQTVRAICEAYDNLTPKEQKHFQEYARIQVKVIQTTDPEFIGELVISTNDQNPMNPRNLKSNSAEQRDIQIGFRSLPKKWFYERKDGELKSLLIASSRVRWFRKSEYAVRPRKFRVIDNEKLAKVWYSFIGYSHSALRGGINYFEEKERVYEMIFKSVPSKIFWDSFSEPYFIPNPDYLELGIPSVYQYLLAFGISSYIEERRISFRNNRADAISRGIQSGALGVDLESGICTNTTKEIDEFLTKDIEYLMNIMINNMREVLIELFSYILCNKYVACNALTAQKLITLMPTETQYINCSCEPSILYTKQDGQALFGPTYEFVKDCIKQYYFEFEAEIKAAPRLKSYLAQRNTVNRLRDLISRRNISSRDYDAPWKMQGKTFIESLPEIPNI